MPSDKTHRFGGAVAVAVAIYVVANSLYSLFTNEHLRELRTVFLYAVGGLAVLVAVGAIRAAYHARYSDRRSRPRTPQRQWQAKTISEPLELRNPPTPPVERPRGDDPDVVRAAKLGKHETVKQLIALGAHLDVEGCGTTDDSALMAAVRSGSKETVEVLIAAGADVNRRIGIFADDTIVETALTVAVASGNRAIVKLLLDHRADLNALNHYYRPNAEEAVALLFEMGEGAHARDLGQAATGVDLPQPDADLLEQARKLGSLFVAFADRFEAQGDRVSATRLYEWKVTAWENRSVWVDDEGDDEWDPPVRVPIHISLCLRTLGECKEAEGELQEALRLYRKALGTWGRHGELVDAAVLDGGYNPFTDLWLQFTLGLVPEGRRNEFAALLSDCERILGRLGMAEEQRRVTVALQRLESISRPGQ